MKKISILLPVFLLLELFYIVNSMCILSASDGSTLKVSSTKEIPFAFAFEGAIGGIGK